MFLDIDINIIYDLVYKIENIENFLSLSPPRHIPAYQKVLGLQQKFNTLSKEEQEYFFTEIIRIRGVVVYFLNGRYKEAYLVLMDIKKKLISIIEEFYEKNRNKTI